jgi:SnoaL-like domain
MAVTQEEARRAQMKRVAEAYSEGMGKKDMSQVPWDDHVVLRSPLAPGGLDTPLAGRSAVLAWFASLFPVLGAMQVIEHYFNDDLTVIATRSDVGITNPPCMLRVVDRFTVNADGKITQQENHYDPRPALPPSAQAEHTAARRRVQLRGVAEAYFGALAKKDFAAIPYDDKVVLRAPLAPGGVHNPLIGKEALHMVWWPPLVPALGDVHIIEHYINPTFRTEALIVVNFYR